MKTAADKCAPSPITRHHDGKPFVAKASQFGFVPPVIQPKLEVSKPDDPLEREADHVADKVVHRASGNVIQRKCTKCEQKEKILPQRHIHPHVNADVIQKKCSACDQKEKLQLKSYPVKKSLISKDARHSITDPELEAALQSSKGKGTPMGDQEKSSMEESFGIDFGNVRIHTGSSAQLMAKHLDAQAFTFGQDIYFNSGKYNPGSSDGKKLLAHELTHTLQQKQNVHRKVHTTQTSVQIQREIDIIELAKELMAANQAQKDAIDPGPAKRTRAAAVAIQAQTAQKSQKKKDTKKGGKGKKLTKQQAKSAAAKKTREAKMALKEEAFKKTLGTVGKDLSNASAFACKKADEKTTKLADNEQTHDDETKKQEQTDQAVVPPVEEGQSLSNKTQVEQLDQTTPPKPDKEVARRTMHDSLEKAMPTNIEEINSFSSKGKAQVVGNQVLGSVSEEVGQVQDKYNDIEHAPPPQPVQEPTELPPQEVAPVTPGLHLGKGAVPPLQPEHTDTKEFTNQSEDLLKKEGIPEDQLNMVDTGDLAEANKERRTLKQMVIEQPTKIKAEAQKETLQVEKNLQAEEVREKSAMKQKRNKGLNETKDKQSKTKTELEKQREKVTADIQAMYNKAKTSVTTRLSNLEKQNLVDFDRGQKDASILFEREVKRDIDAWKDERYSGLFGGVKWLKDKFVGIDHFPEVQKALSDGRANYIRRIDELIVSIDKANQQVILECKQELANAQVEIQKYVAGLGPALKTTGQAAMKEMKTKLAEMDKYIDDQKDKLREKLCSKREEAIKAIDKRIEQMKEEMSGLISKLGNLILDALIKFFKWALEKAGYSPDQLMKIINTARAVIKKIVSSPGGFFRNLANAVKGGIDNFKKNIEKHLIKGLLGWLTGAMSDSGLQLPSTWDLKGIMFLLLQILGLTKDIILKKLSDKIGKPIVDAALKVAGFVQRVWNEGPGAIVDMLKEQAESLKEKVLSTIRNWITVEMIKQGMIKLVSMLNPVGAIVQLIIGIYNAVMFFIENWSRIVEFVKTVFNSIADIAFGRLGPAMAAVENALSMTIPIILNFIARMLGLSGIGKAIKKAIEAIRAPIDKIVDKGLEVVGNAVKAIVGKLSGKKTADKDGKEEKPSQDGKTIALPNKIGETVPFNTPGHQHKVYIERKGTSYDTIVESSPKTVKDKIKEWKKEIQKTEWDNRDVSRKRIEKNIGTVETKLAFVTTESKEVEKRINQGLAPKDAKLRTAEEKLSDALKEIFQDIEQFEDKSKFVVDFKVVFAAKLMSVHKDAKDTIDSTVDKISKAEKGKGFTNIREWSGLYNQIIQTTPAQVLYVSPMGKKNDPGYKGYAHKQVVENASKASSLKGAPQPKIDLAIQNALQGVTSGTQVFIGLRDQVYDKSLKNEVDDRIQALYNSQGEHSRYHPEKVSYSVVGDEFIITYSYKAVPGEKTPTFTVKMKAKDIRGGTLLTQTVIGENLALKPKGSRGVTQKVFHDQPANKPDLNSAHIIADRFMGSGYKSGLNLLATSKEFNQQDMANTEDEIAKDIEIKQNANPTKDVYFTLEVTVTWKTTGDKDILDQFDLLDPNLSKSELKDIYEVLTQKQDPRRCEKVTYKTTVYVDGKPPVKLTIKSIGPDTKIITKY